MPAFGCRGTRAWLLVQGFTPWPVRPGAPARRPAGPHKRPHPRSAVHFLLDWRRRAASHPCVSRGARAGRGTGHAPTQPQSPRACREGPPSAGPPPCHRRPGSLCVRPESRGRAIGPPARGASPFLARLMHMHERPGPPLPGPSPPPPARACEARGAAPSSRQPEPEPEPEPGRAEPAPGGRRRRRRRRSSHVSAREPGPTMSHGHVRERRGRRL